MASGLEKPAHRNHPRRLRRQRPRVAGTRIRVQDVYVWPVEGKTADAIVADFPQLQVADVLCALAYFWIIAPKLSSKCSRGRFRRQNTRRLGPGPIGLEPRAETAACSGFILTKSFLQPVAAGLRGAALM